jgi:hypothetical protein
MKQTFLLFFVFTNFGLSYGQKNIFKVSYFNLDSVEYKTKMDTLDAEGILTIDFYRKHFFIPYYYPKQFVNSDYYDTTVVIWNNPDGDKKFKDNWTLTYTYDKLSRVVIYEYSGCFICSQLPYSLSILYDKLNRPLRLESKTKLNDTKRKIPDEEIELKYDLKGNIIQIKHLRFGKICEQIDKL